MFNSIFKIIYLIEFLLILSIRKYFTTKYRKMDLQNNKRTIIDIIFLILNGIGMIVPLVYVFSPLLDFANYYLPAWIGYVGAGIFLLASWLLWQSHYHLGKNWTPILGIKQEHTLVTSGIYKYIRHPMYAAHLVWAIAQILMLHNLIAGFSFIVVIIPHYLIRIRGEEQMMIQKFGDKYREYMKKTGRLFPRVFTR